MAPLPNEIVGQVLQHLARTCEMESLPTAAYASVSPFWQEFFEAIHFRNLCVTPMHFPDFNKFVVGERRKLVRRIRAEGTYGWVGQWAPKDEIYVYMITTLFETLSKWDIYTSKNPGRVVLEISVRRAPAMCLIFYPQEVIYTPQLSLSRTPPVYAVTGLLLDREVYDVFKVNPRGLHYLLRGLPALKTISTIERALSNLYISYVQTPLRVYERMLQSLPTSVTELTLFEDVRGPFAPASFSIWLPLVNLRRDNTAQGFSMGLYMARASQQLRHLSASFVVDARYFFEPFWPQRPTTRLNNTDEFVWDELQTLAMTSHLFSCPHNHEWGFNQLLEAISMAVRKMPKLRTLEIWNGNDDEDACVFRYSYDPHSRRASLTLKATREVHITRHTERCWDETVRQKTGLGSEIRFERLEIKRPFMALAVPWYMELRDRVITPKALAFAKRHCSSSNA